MAGLNDDTQHRVAIVVSYYILPAPAVGALRPSNTIDALVANGWTVVVLTRHAPSVVDYWRNRHGDRVDVVTVRELPKVLDALARFRNRLVERSVPAAAVQDPTVADAPTQKSWLWRRAHSIMWIIDTTKAWAFAVLWRMIFHPQARRAQVIICSNPPVAQQLAAATMSRIFRIPYIMDMRDPWLGNFGYMEGIRSRLTDIVDTAAQKWCANTSFAVTTASPGIARGMIADAHLPESKVHVIYNGYSGQAAKVSGSMVGRLDMLYAGTIYLNRNPFPLLETVDELLAAGQLDPSLVSMTFVGDCHAYQGVSLADWARPRAIRDVLHIRDTVPRVELESMLAAANIMIVLAQKQLGQIPAKCYDFMRLGKESLVVTESDGDTARIARESRAAVVVDPDSRPAMRAAILDMYRRYAIDKTGFDFDPAAVARFASSAQIARFLELIETRLRGAALQADPR